MGSSDFYRAILDFRHARRQAKRERLKARLSGQSADLFSYEEVRQILRASAGRQIGLRDIPLAAIIGSVGRYSDFTRSFLPLQSKDEQRWAMVHKKSTDLEGLPPIEVYQIGEAYFVRDGNHRVSVARSLGATHIQAYVTTVDSKIPLSPEVQCDDLIAKAEYADFLDRTHLDKVRPLADLSVTSPGQYPLLLEHIEAHRYFMGLDLQREIPYEQALAHWYDQIYLPAVQIIRDQGILQDFPDRTEADLYLWLSEHRADLEAALGWEIEPEAAAADLVEQFGSGARPRMLRAMQRLLDALTPDQLEGGPAAGTWRRERQVIQRDDCLFADILVPVSGDERGWQAVALAVEIACREDARLLGLHVVRSAAEVNSDPVRVIQAEFARQCEMFGVRGKLAVEIGQVARSICERSQWADLVVLDLAYPPAPHPAARLSSGFRTLIRRCPTPVLAVPGTFSPLSRLLLAYDGSPKAKEALYIATYLAARGQDSGDQGPLVVVTVIEGGEIAPDILVEAGEYLETQGVEAILLQNHGPVAEVILEAAQEHGSNLILMGSYGHSPVFEVVLGSVVDRVLRAGQQPVLVCR